MLFDAFCKVVETTNNFSKYKVLCDEAKIFEFTYKDMIKANELYSVPDEENIRYLPFPVTYIECESLTGGEYVQSEYIKYEKVGIFLVELGESMAKTIGNEKLQRFLEYNKVSNEQAVDAFNQVYFYIHIVSAIFRGERSLIVVMGSVGKKLMNGLLPVNIEGVYTSLDNFKNEVKQESSDHRKAVNAFFIYLSTINHKAQFIVECSHTKPRFGNGKKIIRSQDRPRYTVLKPKDISKRYGLGYGGNGDPREAHYRRAHDHTFRDERFTKMKGKTIVMPAMWVGESERTDGNKRYKVLLDK